MENQGSLLLRFRIIVLSAALERVRPIVCDTSICEGCSNGQRTATTSEHRRKDLAASIEPSRPRCAPENGDHYYEYYLVN